MRKDARRHRLARPEVLADPIPAEAFKSEVRAWARCLEVEPSAIHITPMRRKWASCSSRGRLTFDTELLALPEAFRREVVIHELLHLRVPNHGPLFRALLNTYLNGEGPSSVRPVGLRRTM
jgi:predicted metal-dependent hydrolase